MIRAYFCTNCQCVHGWVDHPWVKKVIRYDRGGQEDVWWCPSCNREMRTFDGSFFGQYHKMWIEFWLDPEDSSELQMEHVIHLDSDTGAFSMISSQTYPKAVQRALEQARRTNAGT